MKRKRRSGSSIVNLPTSGLLVRLEQYEKELIYLKQAQLEQTKFLPAQQSRIFQVEDAIFFIKKILVDRYLEDNISLNKIALLFINSLGAKAEVYQEVFVSKVINNKHAFIDQNLLERVVDKLSIENLLRISCSREETSIKSFTKDYTLGVHDYQKINEGIKNLELEEIWFVKQDDKNDILYKFVKESIDERLYSVPEEIEEELLEKIKIDMKEGKKYGKYKR